LNHFGKTFWTSDIETHAIRAEQIVESLRGIGHRNITRSAGVIDKILDGLGFDIAQNGAAVRNSDECIEYSRLARKR